MSEQENTPPYGLREADASTTLSSNPLTPSSAKTVTASCAAHTRQKSSVLCQLQQDVPVPEQLDHNSLPADGLCVSLKDEVTPCDYGVRAHRPLGAPATEFFDSHLQNQLLCTPLLSMLLAELAAYAGEKSTEWCVRPHPAAHTNGVAATMQVYTVTQGVPQPSWNIVLEIPVVHCSKFILCLLYLSSRSRCHADAV